MVKSIYFAIRNIRRYPRRVVVACLCSFVFSCLIAVTCFYTHCSNLSLQREINLQCSGNYVSVRAADENAENFMRNLPYSKETIYLYQSFLSGKMELEGVGSLDINSSLFYTEDGDIPDTFAEELHSVYGEETLLFGRNIQSDNEILLNAGYFSDLQFQDLASLLGKRVTLHYALWNGEDVVAVKEATLVGLVSDKIKKISFFNGSSQALTFLKSDGTQLSKSSLISFFAYGDYENVQKSVAQYFGEGGAVVRTNESYVLSRLSDFIKFVLRILYLMIAVLLLVYCIFFISFILGEIRDKTEYINALEACGLQRRDLCCSLIAELVLIFTLPFFLAGILSFFAARGLLQVTSGLVSASLPFVWDWNILFWIFGLYSGVILIDVILVVLCVYVFYAKENL